MYVFLTHKFRKTASLCSSSVSIPLLQTPPPLSPCEEIFNCCCFLVSRWNIEQRKKRRKRHILAWSRLHVFKGRNLLLTHILVLSKRFKLRRGSTFVTVSSIPKYLKLCRNWKRRRQQRHKTDSGVVAGNPIMAIEHKHSVVFCFWILSSDNS